MADVYLPPIVGEIILRTKGFGKAVAEADAAMDDLETRTAAAGDTMSGSMSKAADDVDEHTDSMADSMGGLSASMAASAAAAGGTMEDVRNNVQDAADGASDAADDVADHEESMASRAKKASSDVKESSGEAGIALGALGGVAAVAAGAFYEGAKANSQFQQSMTQLVTGAGEAQKNIGLVATGIQSMAGQVGQTPEQLAQGMYMIESAGYHGAAGLKILQAAAEGAATGNAAMADVANVVTSGLHDYAIPASRANEVTSALIKTVALGKTHLQDLTTAMASVMPTAAALGVKFQDVTGAMAAMTNSGMKARRAGTDLAFLLRALGDPATSTATQNAFKAVGITAQQLKDQLDEHGLSGALTFLQDAVANKFPKGSVAGIQAFSTLTGGATGYNTALMLTGKNQAAFAANSAAIGKVLNSTSTQVEGFNLVQKDTAFQFDQLKDRLEAVLITVGKLATPLLSALAPVANSLISLLAPVIGTIAKLLQALMPTLQPIISVLTSVLGGVAKLAGSILTDLTPTFQLLGTAVTTVFSELQKTGVLAVLQQSIKQLVPPLAKLIDALIKGLLPALKPIITAMAELAEHQMKSLVTVALELLPVFTTLISKLLPSLVPLLNAILPLFVKLAEVQTDILIPAIKLLAPPLEFLANLLAKIVGFVAKGIGGVAHLISGGLSDIGKLGHLAGSALHVIGLADGGLITKPTLAVVGESGPEMVLPLSSLRGGHIDASGVQPLPTGFGGTATTQIGHQGLHIENMNILGNITRPTDVANELYIRLRPLLASVPL